MKNIYLILFAFSLFSPLLNAQTSNKKEVPIKRGKVHKDSLLAESVHSYIITLDSAQFVHGFANQLSVDVVLKIYDPKSKKIASFDGPGRGRENFQFKTKSSGTYRIQVASFEKNEGFYNIVVSEVEKLATNPAGKVDQLMTHYSGEETPGAAVMVMKDDEIIFQKAYGMANLTYNIPFKTTTPNNIGSTSKQFTAFAISLLANRGKLSFDDDIREYFPEFPDFGKTVTIRNLLTHTSGYRDYLNTLAMTGRDLDANLNSEKIVEIVQRQPELQNDPGAEWNYNNTGFALLAILVERVTDVPFPKWIKENVFEPLNMDHTVVRKNSQQVIPDSSQGYNLGDNGEFQGVSDISGSMGAGGIYTTLGDLAKWIRNFENPTLGNENIIEEMITPFVLTSGDTTNYGFGLFVRDYKGLRLISHGGADLAHRSMIMYFPEIDAAVVTQSNNASFDTGNAFKIAEFFFSKYMDKENSENNPKTPTSIPSYEYDVKKFDLITGSYELEVMPGFILEFKREDQRIYTQATGQPEVDMIAVSDSLFTLKEVNASITFHLNQDGTADSLTLHQNGNHKANLISGWKPNKTELMKFTGKYFSDEIQTIYHVAFENDTLKLGNYRLHEKLVLSPGKKDSFSGEFPITNLIFTRNKAGKITGFKASNGRAKGIFFEKKMPK